MFDISIEPRNQGCLCEPHPAEESAPTLVPDNQRPLDGVSRTRTNRQPAFADEWYLLKPDKRKNTAALTRDDPAAASAAFPVSRDKVEVHVKPGGWVTPGHSETLTDASRFFAA